MVKKRAIQVEANRANHLLSLKHLIPGFALFIHCQYGMSESVADKVTG
ncbi:hypothetical protein GALL_494970 [mine drainage metagenome]|uniref:Uncharacterized protein n=1 Tax=mine drainage metagenome TaxID=410659 RepID=A0A1J5PB73_9ZZZZ